MNVESNTSYECECATWFRWLRLIIAVDSDLNEVIQGYFSIRWLFVSFLYSPWALLHCLLMKIQL